ncbi:hypothetical protein COU37_03835 [Candidatus Micrarchaeota archaeon CG10_big_fil_rev_8_21_14_0_10_45_29]|nr:MAG: hypothetical protein COU37_03835 [Candidatus Micrarchaeota archaeon CG10_big_fil_rev_8_21_14_0_10_45_29]
MASSPTLNTVLMVEKTLENMGKSAFSVADLKKELPKQVNHNTLMVILDYLQKSNKIFVGVRGISWIENSNQNLKKAIAKGIEL